MMQSVITYSTYQRKLNGSYAPKRSYGQARNINILFFSTLTQEYDLNSKAEEKSASSRQAIFRVPAAMFQNKRQNHGAVTVYHLFVYPALLFLRMLRH
jgi:hypothetical protein